MTYEIYTGAGLGTQVRIKKEAVVGTDPVIADTDLAYVENGTFSSYERESLERPGMSAHRRQFKNVPGGFEGSCSFEFPLFCNTLADASARPPFDAILCAAGFVASGEEDTNVTAAGVTPDAADDDVAITYTAKSKSGRTNASCRIEAEMLNQDDTKAIKQTIAGCVFTWVLSIAAGQPWMFSVEGKGQGSKPTENATPSIDEGFDIEPPVMGMACEWAIEDLSDSSFFGGGTLASPNTANIQLASLEFNGNHEQVKRGGIGANGSTFSYQLVATGGPVSAKAVLELTNLSDWDWYTRLENAQGLRLYVTGFMEDTTKFITAEFTCQAANITLVDGPIVMVELDLVGIAPENASDGGGKKPSDNFTLRFCNVNVA